MGTTDNKEDKQTAVVCQKVISDKGESKARVSGGAGRGCNLKKGGWGRLCLVYLKKKLGGGLYQVFMAMLWLSLPEANGGSSSLQCEGFSLQWPFSLQSMSSWHTGFSS